MCVSEAAFALCPHSALAIEYSFLHIERLLCVKPIFNCVEVWEVKKINAYLKLTP